MAVQFKYLLKPRFNWCGTVWFNSMSPVASRCGDGTHGVISEAINDLEGEGTYLSINSTSIHVLLNQSSSAAQSMRLLQTGIDTAHLLSRATRTLKLYQRLLHPSSLYLSHNHTQTGWSIKPILEFYFYLYNTSSPQSYYIHAFAKCDLSDLCNLLFRFFLFSHCLIHFCSPSFRSHRDLTHASYWCSASPFSQSFLLCHVFSVFSFLHFYLSHLFSFMYSLWILPPLFPRTPRPLFPLSHPSSSSLFHLYTPSSLPPLSITVSFLS